MIGPYSLDADVMPGFAATGPHFVGLASAYRRKSNCSCFIDVNQTVLNQIET